MAIISRLPSGGGRKTEYEQVQNYLMLYDSGDECIDVTGGWSASGYTGAGVSSFASPTKQSDRIVFSGSGNRAIGTVDSINVSEYKLACVIDNCTNSVDGYGFESRICPSKYISSPSAHWGYDGVLGKRLRVVDISSISSKVYFVSHMGTTRTGEIYNMFLVKSDFWQQLCNLANIEVPEDMATLLADSESLSAILRSSVAVDYMLKRCTGDFMVSAVQSSTFIDAMDSSTFYEQIYENEHWSKFLELVGVPKRTYLYNQGDECVALTGGWNGWTRNGANLVAKKETNRFVLNPPGSAWQMSGFATAIKIDFTNYKKIVVNAPSMLGSDTYTCLSIVKDVSGDPWQKPNKLTDAIEYRTSGQYELDISSFSESGHVIIFAYQVGGSIVDKIWLE